MSNKKIIIAGTIRGGAHQQDQIISSDGVCKCLTAGSHMNAAWMTLIAEIKYEQQETCAAAPK